MKIKFNLNTFIYITLILTIIAMVTPLFISACYNERLNIKENVPYKGWTYIIGGNKTMKANETAIISNKLPKKIHKNDVLLFRSDNQKISVYIGNKKIYNFGEGKKLKYLNSQSGNWNVIELTSDMSEKEVWIEAMSPYVSFAGKFNDIFIVSHNEALFMILKKGFMDLVLGFFLLVSSIYFMVLAFISGKVNANTPAFKNISIFYLCISLWIFGQSKTLEIIINNTIFIYFTTILSYMIAPLFFLKFIGYRNHQYKQIGSYLTILICIDIIFSISLQLFTNVDLWQSLITSNVNMLLCVIFFFAIKLNKVRNNKMSFRLYLAAITAGIYIVGVIYDITNFISGRYEVYGNSTGLATCVVATYVVIDFMIHARNVEQVSYHLKEELTQNELSLLLNQIKPHFLYNALNSISYLCKTNPEKADEVVVKLARYLRHNTNYIDKIDLIDFNIEIQHIENYVSIEKVRFPKIDVIFDLDVTNFRVPPLTMQPIVENAIKHGVSKKLDGGTIVLKTYERKGYIYIVISDNGIGFDKDKIDYNTSHGLNNIIRRLNLLCNAELNIDSCIGEGTTISIRIPTKIEGI